MSNLLILLSSGLPPQPTPSMKFQVAKTETERAPSDEMGSGQALPVAAAGAPTLAKEPQQALLAKAPLQAPLPMEPLQAPVPKEPSQAPAPKESSQAPLPKEPVQAAVPKVSGISQTPVPMSPSQALQKTPEKAANPGVVPDVHMEGSTPSGQKLMVTPKSTPIRSPHVKKRRQEDALLPRSLQFEASCLHCPCLIHLSRGCRGLSSDCFTGIPGLSLDICWNPWIGAGWCLGLAKQQVAH